MPNRYPGPCIKCGRTVESGAGTVDTRRDPDTHHVRHVVAHLECPPRREAHSTPIGPELPRWALYCEWTRADGRTVTGVRLVDGERPEGEVVPVNEAARALE